MIVVARFLVLLLPRVLTGRCTPGRLAGYAIALEENNKERLAEWCWARAIQRGARDEHACDTILDTCVRAGRYEAAERCAGRIFNISGFRPMVALRLVGDLVLASRFDAALRIFDSVLERTKGDMTHGSPAPAWQQPADGKAVRHALARHRAGQVTDAAETTWLCLATARLCFSYAAFDASARLFERARGGVALEVEDEIAALYSALRAGREHQAGTGAVAIDALASRPAGPDWSILLATVLFANGSGQQAASAIEVAVRTRFAGHPDLERMAADYRRMIECIGRCPHTLKLPPGGGPEEYSAGMRKLFICGNGWSGSGAVYDALTEFGGIREAPDTPADAYLNACTGRELMFVQGMFGLGRLWREARAHGELPRRCLWEFLRCHLTGGGAIGFPEHKGARSAANLLNIHGGRYTRIFREAYESLANMAAEGASLGELRRILSATTEAISRELSDGSGECIVFNNAVFGPNVDMLEIFNNFRGAVVVRDPLDQYADRRSQDIKHWMTPGRFVDFYLQSRKAFRLGTKELPAQLAREVREVEFEKFVLDERYRSTILQWLLEGVPARRLRRRFEPRDSARNVGIHSQLLVRDERDVIARGLERWLRS